MLCAQSAAAGPAPFSDPPTAATTTMGQTATGSVLADANLPAGVTATVTGFSIEGTSKVYPPGSTVPLADPVTGVPIGTLTVAADGSYTFDPVDGYVGPVPTVNVYEKASNGQTAISTLTLNVVPGEAPWGGGHVVGAVSSRLECMHHHCTVCGAGRMRSSTTFCGVGCDTERAVATTTALPVQLHPWCQRRFRAPPRRASRQRAACCQA